MEKNPEILLSLHIDKNVYLALQARTHVEEILTFPPPLSSTTLVWGQSLHEQMEKQMSFKGSIFDIVSLNSVSTGLIIGLLWFHRSEVKASQ